MDELSQLIEKSQWHGIPGDKPIAEDFRDDVEATADMINPDCFTTYLREETSDNVST